MPRGVSLATLPRASEELAVLVTRPRDWRSSTRRVIRLADRSVALARSAIRSSRLGASERCMIVVYSLAVRPAPLIRSLSRCRGMTLTIRITARQSASSVGESGSAVAMSSRIACFAKQSWTLGPATPGARPPPRRDERSDGLRHRVRRMMNETPAGRVAIVVGAAGELGRATAVKLADRGMTVVAVDRNESGLEGLPDGIAREVVDATDPNAARSDGGKDRPRRGRCRTCWSTPSVRFRPETR